MFADAKLIATVERGELWTDGLLNVTPSAVLSVSILTNNVVVSFFAFCSGVVFGLGTFYLIGLNGISLGAIFAFTGQHGLAGRLFDFVIAHGCVELSCICIAGAAGAYLGEALIRPGELTRSEAFRVAAAGWRARARGGYAAALHLRVHRGIHLAGSGDAALGARHHRGGLLALHDLAAARLRVRPQPRRPAGRYLNAAHQMRLRCRSSR